jgi:hypothetical protein
MTRDEVDAFLRSPGKTLPAAPAWRMENRDVERRTGLSVALDGTVTSVKLNITIRLNDPSYLMLGLSAPPQICRLCLTTGHRDRVTKTISYDAHFHSWEANRPKGLYLPKRLEHQEPLPSHLVGRDDAFAWFLSRHMIDFPSWLPVTWPAGALV